MNFSSYIGKNIIAWLSYDERGAERSYNGINDRCYVYPRFLIDGDSCVPIDKDDFPNYGCLVALIRGGGEDAEEVCRRFGSLVNIKINTTPFTNYNSNNIYSLKYNSQYSKDMSEIWIDYFSGKNFYQIVDIDEDIDTFIEKQSIEKPKCSLNTTLILLRYENNLYGPFEYDEKEGILNLRGLKENQYIVGAYEAFNYNDDVLIVEDNDNAEAVSLLPKTLLPQPEDCSKHYDWISNKKLIDSFIEALRSENSFTRTQIGQMKEAALSILESSADINYTDYRIDKIKELIQTMTEDESNIQGIIKYALENDATKEIIVKEVAKNHFDSIKSEITECSSIQEHIDELARIKSALEEQVEHLEERNKENTCVISEEDKARIEELEEKVQELLQKNEEMEEVYNAEKDIEALKKEKEYYQEERNKAKEKYDQQVIDNNELERKFNDKLDEFKDKATVTAKVLDNKLLEKVLRSVGEDIDEQEMESFDQSYLHAPMNGNEIIKRVASVIRDKAHRDVSDNDVANYLICLSQGFITTFAGEPGTGKTSLCNIIAKSLGLASNDKNRRFVDVSVERGWTSHKDFIGYYNPLTKNVEKSNLDVYNAFSQMDAECDCTPSQIAPFVVLLDEANLSPIEHYWAAFLRNCDSESAFNKSIPLGGNKSFKLPEHLRFLATVNFDHTTEELSPRFLDRSWVVTLEPSRIDEEQDEEVVNLKDIVPFESLKNAFYATKEDTIDEAILTKWEAIQSIFRSEKCSMQIMPRNLKMVRNYCAVACRCMDRDTPLTRLAPLDYAFSQKILPTINGSGENYKTLIDELLKECTDKNMPISNKHLVRMKKVAENNMGFYQFFAR